MATANDSLWITGGPGIAQAVGGMIAGRDDAEAVALAILEAMECFTSCPRWSAWAAGWLSGDDRFHASAYRAKMEAAFSRAWGVAAFPAWWAENAAAYAAGAARVLDAPFLAGHGRADARVLAMRSLACGIHCRRGDGLHLSWGVA